MESLVEVFFVDNNLFILGCKGSEFYYLLLINIIELFYFNNLVKYCSFRIMFDWF